MAKSVAELVAEHAARAEQPVRPERVYRAIIGEGQKYVVEVLQFNEELKALIAELTVLEATEQKKPRKNGAGVAPRILEIRERIDSINGRLAELAGLMGEYEGELTIRATSTEGEWKRWRLAHPARDEDEPGRRDDLLLAGGHCNVDDLMAELATYVVAWNGEPLGTAGFDALSLLRPDKKEIAAIVVGFYETGDDLPKLRADLSAYLESERSSSSRSE